MMEEKLIVVPREPEDIPELFVEYWNIRRADLLAELFVEDADFVNVVGLWWNNKADIFKAHDYGLKVIFQDSKMTVVRLKTRYLSNDIAVVHARLRLVGQTENKGIDAGVRRNMLTFVVQRNEQNLWKAVAAQNTDIIHGAETLIRKEDGSVAPADYR